MANIHRGNDSKSHFDTLLFLERSYKGSLLSNEKRAIYMRTNKINSDSGEQRYAQLSNS